MPQLREFVYGIKTLEEYVLNRWHIAVHQLQFDELLRVRHDFTVPVNCPGPAPPMFVQSQPQNGFAQA